MKPHVIRVSCNAKQTIMLCSQANNAQHIELLIAAGANVICIDDRRFDVSNEHSLRITVQKNGRVLYCDRRDFNMDAQVNNAITLIAHRDSVISFEQWQQGARSMTTKIDSQVCGENAEINVRVGMQIDDNQTYSVTTSQHHASARATTNCVVKAIVAGSARSLYEGMIQIDVEAQASKAFQDHKAMLISDRAYAYARPSLQVHADDVQCGHGSAIGQFDSEQLLYLQARGIDTAQAEKLLLHAFMDGLYSSEHLKNHL